MLNIWRGIDTRDPEGANGLVKFALRILSIVPNSAMTERFFSRLGIVQNKYRNRMHSERARKVVLIKAECDRIYGTGRSHRPRHFGRTDPDSDSNSEDEQVLPTTATTNGPLATLEAEGASNTTTSASFLELASELIASAEADDGEAPESDDEDVSEPPTLSTVASHDQSSLPLPEGVPVPRSEALTLRHLFRYPSNPLASSDENILAAFWNASKQNLEEEVNRYNAEAVSSAHGQSAAEMDLDR